MADTKVTDADLRAYLEEGHSQADAARHFGVREPAIHQSLKRMRQLTSRVVALEQAGAIVEEKLSATAPYEVFCAVTDVLLFGTPEEWELCQLSPEGQRVAAYFARIARQNAERR